METALIFIGFACIIVGIIGSVLPLPGPPLAFLGMLAIHYSKVGPVDTNTLYVLGFLTLLVFVLDYLIPIWGSKKFGGSKWGSIGSGLGLFAGMFLGPFGIFIGAFAGAFIGEYLSQKNQHIALKAAIGSFLGILCGMFFKISLCLLMLYYAVVQVGR